MFFYQIHIIVQYKHPDSKWENSLAIVILRSYAVHRFPLFDILTLSPGISSQFFSNKYKYLIPEYLHIFSPK